MGNTREAITLVTRHHKEFITMAKAIAGNSMEVRNYAEDFVQEAYVRLMRYDDLYDKIITKKGTVSKGYVFFTLRSIILNSLKKKSNPKFNHLGDQYDFEEKFMHVDKGRDPEDTAKEALEAKMLEVLKENIHWFDYELFRYYVTSGKSYKTLAAETGIGLRTIYLSIKKSKLIIAQHLHEDYQDFINGDWHLI